VKPAGIVDSIAATISAARALINPQIIRAQYQHRDPAAGEVLLIADLLVGRDEKVKTRVFGGT